MTLVRLSAFILFSILVVGCNASSDGSQQMDQLAEVTKFIEEEQMETKEVEGRYTIDVLKSMVSTTLLNEDASLQYNNLYQEKYLIVIDEDKQEFIDALTSFDEYDENASVLDNYARIQLYYLQQASNVKEESELKKEKINGMEARLKAIDAEITGVPEAISYWLGYVEGQDALYTVMVWTLENRKKEYEIDAHKMIRSLKELQ